MSFLGLEGRSVLVMGVANRKSVAAHAARLLLDEGASLLLSVRDDAAARQAEALFPGVPLLRCDVERQEEIDRLPEAVAAHAPRLDGLLHSIAFANYSDGWVPFHETRREDFLQAVNISAFSLVAAAKALKDCFAEDAGVVTVSISATDVAAENYGYMAPVKAALDASLAFLAKSFSAFSAVRFNAVRAGLLKTASSAGIPGYVESYLYAERLTLRGRNPTTEEVARAAVFLLSPAASGVNASGLVVDAGMHVNPFDAEVIRRVMKGDS